MAGRAAPVMVLGSGRLSLRVQELLASRGYSIVHMQSAEFDEGDHTSIEEASLTFIQVKLREGNINEVSAVVIADAEDDVNMRLLMAARAVVPLTPIVVSMFRERIIQKLESRYHRVTIVNPAHIASTHFVDILERENGIPRRPRIFGGGIRQYREPTHGSIVKRLLAGFCILFGLGAVFFRYTEPIGWDRSVYLLITVVTSVNFGDAELTNYHPVIKNIRTLLLFCIYFYIPFALTAVLNHMDKRRQDTLLGKKKYHMQDHVIVCGLGKVGYQTVKRLVDKKFPVLALEINEDNLFLPEIRSLGVPVYITDSRLAHSLENAGVEHARAVLALINDEMLNLEIGLTARAIDHDVRLVLRIFDQDVASHLRTAFDIQHAFSKSTLAAQEIVASVEKQVPALS